MPASRRRRRNAAPGVIPVESFWKPAYCLAFGTAPGAEAAAGAKESDVVGHWFSDVSAKAEAKGK